jgi:hypothetical protein
MLVSSDYLVIMGKRAIYTGVREQDTCSDPVGAARAL